MAHSTVWAILNRHGCSRVRAERRESVRYEWPCPGDLVHVDVKRYPRFRRPGHAVTGDRAKTGWDNRHLMGWDYFHAMVDDDKRLAYGELLADEKATTVTAFFERPGRLCRSRHPGPARDDRRCVVLHPQPLAARVLYRPRDPPHHHPALHAALEREGRARPPDHGTRVGPRACATATAKPETKHCHTGSATTTSADPTQPLTADHPSAALTTSQGRTASYDASSGRSRPRRPASSAAEARTAALTSGERTGPTDRTNSQSHTRAGVCPNRPSDEIGRTDAARHSAPSLMDGGAPRLIRAPTPDGR